MVVVDQRVDDVGAGRIDDIGASPRIDLTIGAQIVVLPVVLEVCL